MNSQVKLSDLEDFNVMAEKNGIVEITSDSNFKITSCRIISEANFNKKLQYSDESFDKTDTVKRGERAREAAHFWRAL